MLTLGIMVLPAFESADLFVLVLLLAVLSTVSIISGILLGDKSKWRMILSIFLTIIGGFMILTSMTFIVVVSQERPRFEDTEIEIFKSIIIGLGLTAPILLLPALLLFRAHRKEYAFGHNTEQRAVSQDTEGDIISCKCKSGCQSKRCICFKMEKSCGHNCECTNCHNPYTASDIDIDKLPKEFECPNCEEQLVLECIGNEKIEKTLECPICKEELDRTNLISSRKNIDLVGIENHRNEKSWTGHVIGGISLKFIVEGFKAYRATVLDVLRYRSSYARRKLIPFSSNMLSIGIITYLYTAAIGFIISLPLIKLKNLSYITKWSTLLFSTYNLLALVFLFHFSIRVFGGKGRIRPTIAAIAISAGVFGLFKMVIVMPIRLFAVPANVELFFINPFQRPIDRFSSVPDFLIVFCMALYLIVVIYWLLINFRLMADIYQITFPRLVMAILLVFYPLTFVFTLYVTPNVNRVLFYLSEILKPL